jgi:hypothetical protein
MGFFFRRSTSFGPFRLNFSKSGIGGSLGVKGARLTMTPRGTTYVTVGSHGFYYREALSSRQDIRRLPPAPTATPPQTGSPEGRIASAGSSDLVDSSSERLVQQLNERASKANPAWILYVGALMSIAGLAMVPAAPTLSKLPVADLRLTTERSADVVDEYSALTARYGEPDSIVFTESDAIVRVPIATAKYDTPNVNVLFVPIGCTRAYSHAKTILAETSANAARSRLQGVVPCLPSPDTGWTTVGYISSTDDLPMFSDRAAIRLNAIAARRTTAPIVEVGDNTKNTRQGNSRGLTNKKAPKRPEMKSNHQSRLAEEKMRSDIKGAESLVLYYRSALLFAAISLFIAGAKAHRKNEEERKSRLVYELDEAELQKHRTVQQSLGLLSTCHRLWRIEAESGTSDWKRNAGASSLVRRSTVAVKTVSPPRVETNVPVPCIILGRSQLYFLPDIILYRDDNGFGAIPYTDFRVEQGVTRFIESDGVPADAAVIGHTWRYVNKNGGPDRRFNNNRQLPILQLGVLVFSSSKGLNIQINTSNPQRSITFADSWRTLFQPVREFPSEQTESKLPPRREAQPSKTTAARKILGVTENASGTEISAAYRRLAQMYHPDKVAGLAPEFQALADTRMTEISNSSGTG